MDWNRHIYVLAGGTVSRLLSSQCFTSAVNIILATSKLFYIQLQMYILMAQLCPCAIYHATNGGQLFNHFCTHAEDQNN